MKPSAGALMLVLVCPAAGCSQSYQRDVIRTIDLPLRYDVETTRWRVFTAAAINGFPFTQISPDVASIGPYQLDVDHTIWITLRANMVASDSGSRVIVSGFYGENQPIVYATKGRNAIAWNELTRFVEAIRRTRPHYIREIP